ncbi:MAG: hypothetical protein ACMXYG_04585 [Candidatus Woesearchaeota archaeon]
MIKKIRFEGFYHNNILPEGKGNLEGIIEIASDGSFEGTINDYGLGPQMEVIKGHLKHKNTTSHLEFLKFPPDEDLANLFYSLKKEGTGMQAPITGKYVGEWNALPVKVNYDTNYNIFIAKIDTNICCLYDYAEVIILKD